MSVDQAIGLSFKLIENQDDFTEWSPEIRMLVKEYLLVSDDKYKVADIMNIMSIAAGSGTMFILLCHTGGIGIGLLTAHAINHQDTGSGAMVHIGYVAPHIAMSMSREIVDTGMEHLFEWAKSLNMISIFAQTRRNERPFDKLLMRTGWKRFTTVYQKEIENVKPQASITDAGRPVTA